MGVCKLSHVHVCVDYNVSAQDRGQTYMCNLICRPLEMIWFSCKPNFVNSPKRNVLKFAFEANSLFVSSVTAESFIPQTMSGPIGLCLTGIRHNQM